VLRLGVVSFLNARPLVEGLTDHADIECVFDVPAALPQRLLRGEVDVALVPLIDVLRAGGRLRVVSDACIGCDGQTLTVRVLSRVPPEQIETLWVDPDSHTSVALAQLIWRQQFGRALELQAIHPDEQDAAGLDCVLLIGDKVVSPHRGEFAYELDLGSAWRELTGLPFVFAVWASLAPGPASPGPVAASGLAGRGTLDDLLARARDRGVARASEIAAKHGPRLGWPVELAEHYLTRCMRYTLDERARAGAKRFAKLCAEAGLVPKGANILWARATAAVPHGVRP